MLTRPPDDVDRALLRRRREQKTASARRGRWGDYFYKREVTADDRARLVELGHVRESEVDDPDVVRAALNQIIDDHLGK